MAFMLRLSVLAVAAGIGFAGRDADGDMALTVEADTHFRKLAHARAHANVTRIRTVKQLGAAVVEHVNKYSMEPQNIAAFHLKAQSTVMAAIMMFSDVSNPDIEPDYVGGINKIGTGFFECVELLLPDNVKAEPYFDDFREAWMAMFEDLLKVDDDIKKHIDAYAKNAQAIELAQVVRICVKAGMEMIKRFLPEEALKAVENYFAGIEEIMDGVVESWTAFTSGNTVQGVEAAYDGLQGAATAVLPDSIKNAESYKVIMGTLDTQIAKLNEYVLTFRRKLQESKVCWRSASAKGKKQASTCGSPKWRGFYYAGRGVCKKGSGLLEVHASEHHAVNGESLLEEVLHRKGDDNKEKKKKKKKKVIQRDAICDPDSEYGDHIGRYCYKPCPVGLISQKSGTGCITKCWGEKSFASTNLFGEPNEGDMCGASPQMIQMVTTEMLTAVVGAAIKVSTMVMSMIDNGRVTADALNAIIQEFVTLSVAFANPHCPLEGVDNEMEFEEEE